MKIRVKLFLLLFPMLLLSGLTINYLTGRAVCTTLHEETAARTAAGAERLLESAEPDFAAPRENKLLPFLYALAGELRAANACFADAGGTILAHTDVVQKGRKLPLPGSGILLSAGGGHEIAEHSERGLMRVYVPVNARKAESPEELALLGAGGAEKRLGTLVVYVPLKDGIATEKYIARKSAIILAAVYLAILLTAFLLTGAALRPIRRLIAGTERIRLGDYDTLIPAHSRDEFGDLARSFNEMSRTLSGTIVSKNYLNAILDNMLDILVVMDMDGLIKKTNRATQAALGVSEKELEGVRMLKFFPKENQDSGYWHQQMRSKGEVRDHEAVMVTAAGASIPVLASGSYIKNTAGENTGVVLLIRDITLRKKYEAEIARSNEDLKRFAFVASHDLQEPLRTICSYIELLESKYRTVLGPEAETHAAFITGAVRRMRNLVRDLLDYSKINAPLQLKEVDTGETLNYVLAMLQDRISAAGAVIERGDLPLILADQSHIERLFQNLIVNAIKFKNAGAPLIKIGAEPGAGEWIFSVRDNGIGIDGGHKAKLFTLFGRLHGNGVDGAGIGLAACKRIVECYGGRIWFESSPGKGSAFFFSIPGQPGVQSRILVR